MTAETTPNSLPDGFGEPIYAYTAAQAVQDGTLLQFSPATALEAGYALPVLLTQSAYQDAIEWTRPRDEWMQGEDARFWDVLNVARAAGKRAIATGRPCRFKLSRIANRTKSGAWSKSTTAATTFLEVRIEGFDLSGRPCLIISTPGED